MKSIRNIIFGISFFLGFFVNSFATNFPFSDIPETSPYYSAVKYLFEHRIISDDGSGRFHPEDTIERDVFVGLSVSVSCKKCLPPTPADIIRYTASPFPDLLKKNQYFYCIAYASEKGIVQGYITDTTGKSSCQDGTSYSSNPFCENNKTSRIEAAGMLLRQAKLWDDTRNTGYNPKMDIIDTSLLPGSYWRGYAEKGVEAGILTIKNRKIYPDEYIARGEFAQMAAKMLSYNQCQTKEIDTTAVSEIRVKDPLGNMIDLTQFPLGYTGNLTLFTSTGSWGANWTLSHPESGTVHSGSGLSYPISLLDKCGTWIVTTELIDMSTGQVVSVSQGVFIIECPGAKGISLSIRATPRPKTTVGQKVNLSSFPGGGIGEILYAWDMNDGSTDTRKNPDHIYERPGFYRVVLRITDSIGQTASAQLVVEVVGDDDSDDDGVPDDQDICRDVAGSGSTGCPVIIPFDPYSLSGSIEGITPYVGSSDIINNCILRQAKERGLILGEPSCTQCPCTNSVTLIARIRTCDIVFPTILSRDYKTIFSRGGLFQVE